MWDRVWVSTFYGLLAVLVIMDILAWLDRDDRTPTLTAILLREVPHWVLLAAVTWLWIHVASRILLRRPLL
ncbi:MAG: hypothetical protein QN173_05275 [Armatimonadota bacterium]|nr:hypothetical protein [Armatimonadota bacterium]MDR7402637.1 hypothetical protein [Armatimonadota bacterium]MDR7404985.1 hypothetical protein [Armatimonadota bacterium]MDR7436761.1 hypothetical protein [Armatimonadota bacterium]MDR7472708.1 hypothetical protein [Armatimonadota bacterium]